ncbi:peptidase [Planotetraspora thailandica]|uniref:Peptidase n=1 Tax=Planotetraspora thailandica TaxID=487172 RepID=A0A8J3VG09_9ACTN|nr:serine hydrolase domain-containing protein [Planotetraspora thailandica]GII57945.1 peptidase [Planotetraspora thailandica]
MHGKRLLSLGLITALLIAGTAGPALAVSEQSRNRQSQDLQQRLDRLTRIDGLPGAIVHVTDQRGRTVTVTSGTAELGTGRRMVGPDARFRIASVSKPFIAVTVLKLGIDLDKPVERYLPGVLRGTGEGAAIDGRDITVRQLLLQTSGLPEFADIVDWSKGPQDYLKLALSRKPTGEPGERWSYSNTNYLVAGMIVEKVTGRDYQAVTREQIFDSLGMKDTYWPEPGELGIRGPHAHTYGVHPLTPDAGVIDVTELPGHEFGPSGGLISTPADLNRFWRGVFEGRLLPAKTVHTMIAGMVPSGAVGDEYGLGVAREPLSCGGSAWFHDGDLPGVSTVSGTDRKGRQATVYVTGSADTPARRSDLYAVFDAALCLKH